MKEGKPKGPRSIGTLAGSGQAMPETVTEEITALPALFLDGEIPTRDDLAAVSMALMDVNEFYLQPLIGTIIEKCDGGRLTDDEFGRLYRWCLQVRETAEDMREHISNIAVAASEATGTNEPPFDVNGYVRVDMESYRSLRERIGFEEAT